MNNKWTKHVGEFFIAVTETPPGSWAWTVTTQDFDLARTRTGRTPTLDAGIVAAEAMVVELQKPVEVLAS